MTMLPTVDFFGKKVTRLICGGMVNVGMFQKHKNQAAENSTFVREILEGRLN